jgi:hypothetical protein
MLAQWLLPPRTYFFALHKHADLERKPLRDTLSWVIMVMTGGYGMKLKGKVAIITGAGRGMGRGMGRAIAGGYAREGF